MKTIVNSAIIAFSMYSKIPMPRTSWRQVDMKYVMCFFPLVGVLVGGCVFLVGYVTELLSFGKVFWAVAVTLIPILVTGGIHMDGFLDTIDAKASYQPIEKKLEILKDPHAGAFAIIAGACYVLFMFAIWYEMDTEAMGIITVGFVLSRALSGLLVVTGPLAKSSGLAATFFNGAKKKTTRNIMLLVIVVSSFLMLYGNVLQGGLCILAAAIVYVFCRHMAKKQFGGITGDIAGYFLQVCELMMALAVVIGGKLCG